MAQSHLSKKNPRQRLWVASTVGLLASTIFLFQNCSPGFEVAPLESIEGLGGRDEQLEEANPEVAPIAPNPIPALQPPVSAVALNMNVSTRVPLAAVDLDTPVSELTFILRTPPVSGQVTLDPVGAQTNRGLVYTPNPGFIGTDSVTLAISDPQGNVGPNQTYQIRVEQKGIGQIVGTWVKPTCVPTTSAVVGTYTATLTNFQFVETIYSADCAVAVLEHRFSGNHAIGLENVPTTGGITGFEYNVTGQVSTMRPLSAAAAQALNAQAYCGMTGWAANVTRDITLTGCSGVWASANLYMYRRVEYPAGMPARLFITDLFSGGNGVTPATRTQGLLQNFILLKQ
ncbi:MAG: Ig-like domain-containing protein [Bdellovibrionales bacterium]|nr:Ig-like domain-containing protein [Bdellovibrionales bacterium]